MTAPAPLDAAVREAENALAIEANCITPRCPECFPRFRESLRSLLAAISADKRLEEALDLLRSARRYHDAGSPMGCAIDRYFAKEERP